MRRLVLVRHAKAGPHEGADVERELAPRGRRDARAVGEWLAAQELEPDRVVVSPAVRARQTWEAATVGLSAQVSSRPQRVATPRVEPVVDDRVYENTVEDLLAVVRATPDAVATLVVVGHNPSVSALAITLDDGAGEAGARRQLTLGFPTAGVAVLDLGASTWAQAAAAACTLAAFAAPRG